MMLEGIEHVLIEETPDWVLLYGDTNSTIAGALAAAKIQIPVAHVEAGLRSFNRRMPEEINRIVTDHLSAVLFAPTDMARDNLRREGIDESIIVPTGDVMLDAAMAFRDEALERSAIVSSLGLEAGRYVLATVHRAENTDSPERLRSIVDGLIAVTASIPVVLPLHPRTRARIEEDGLDTGSLRITPPLGFLDMVRLEVDAAVVATDSGGVQKEAYFHRVPCVTLRDETEWVELVDSGWNRLVSPSSAAAICAGILGAAGVAGLDVDLYGNGDAARTIAGTLLERSAVSGAGTTPRSIPSSMRRTSHE
jgi:UDP-GlcNAc3NAcA epimerase